MRIFFNFLAKIFYFYRIFFKKLIFFIEGYANQEEADSTWGTGWRDNCDAVIEYSKE